MQFHGHYRVAKTTSLTRVWGYKSLYALLCLCLRDALLAFSWQNALATCTAKSITLRFLKVLSAIALISKWNCTNIFCHPIRAHYHYSVILTVFWSYKHYGDDNLVIQAWSKTFVQKPFPESRMQNWLWNNCLDFITVEMWLFKFTQIEPSELLSREMLEVQNRRYCRTQGNSEIDSLTQDTIDRAVKELKNDWGPPCCS